jgi:hypothetical protein
MGLLAVAWMQALWLSQVFRLQLKPSISATNRWWVPAESTATLPPQLKRVEGSP